MQFKINAIDSVLAKRPLTQSLVKANQARLEAASNGAFCQRGPNKGHLKAKCPPMGTDAAIFWQATQMASNPFRVSIAQLIFLTDDQRHFFNLVEDLAHEAIKRKHNKAA